MNDSDLSIIYLSEASFRKHKDENQPSLLFKKINNVNWQLKYQNTP